MISGQSFEATIKANERARESGTRFFVINSFGYFGYTFEDLGPSFSYNYKDKAGNDVQGSKSFVPFENSMKGKTTRRTNALYLALRGVLPAIFPVLITVLYEHEKRHGSEKAIDIDELLATTADLVTGEG